MGASVWVDIKMEDIETRDLLDELENRYLDKRERDVLFSIAQDGDPKVKLFMKHIDKFSLVELEQMFGDQPVEAVSENQLKLELKD